MTPRPGVRKAVLVTHVTTSVGWLGAVAAYLALDLTAVFSADPSTVRSAYVAMGLIAERVIVPLALAAVVVGVINALTTPWGLFRHYWVLLKLLLTLFATTILLIESQTISSLADAAASGDDPRGLPGTLPHSIGGLVVLLIVLIVSVYKPRGLTKYGWRQQQRGRREPAPSP
ncbi:hypothetical protein GCM10009789_62650 [Kribbella sancticallisti]|uniref:DUF2269 domain-containing protein n=1 Tax=Kribbella sancticallisti TaxID=460087 RepID=A0ABP4Q3S9_9ACTN